MFAKLEKSVAEIIKLELSGQFGDFEKFRDRVIYVSDKIEDLAACKKAIGCRTVWFQHNEYSAEDRASNMKGLKELIPDYVTVTLEALFSIATNTAFLDTQRFYATNGSSKFPSLNRPKIGLLYDTLSAKFINKPFFNVLMTDSIHMPLVVPVSIRDDLDSYKAFNFSLLLQKTNDHVNPDLPFAQYVEN